MLSVLILCGLCVFANAHLQQITLPVYVPPSQEVILNKYFQSDGRANDEIIRKGRKDVGIYEILKNDLTKNITKSTDEIFGKNIGKEKVAKNITSEDSNIDELWLGLLKKLLQNSYETTTYRYPTATWTPQYHETLKETQKNRFKKMPKIFLMKPSELLKPILKSSEERVPRYKATTKPKRGKIKLKNSRQKLPPEVAYRGIKKEEVDKFLEQSLLKYLVSTNLIENIGNVSVETFSEILKNVTRQKANKRQFWPYDENKELRIKFRDEVFMKRKSENPNRGKFLEKQLQRRLERAQGHWNWKNKDKAWRKGNSVEVQDRKMEMVTVPAESALSSAELTTLSMSTEKDAEHITFFPDYNVTEPTRITEILRPGNKSSVKFDKSADKPVFEELKLSVAETVYYKKRPFHLPPHADDEEAGVIPGIPQVDYPMYSSPPTTGFKCPRGIGDQPRMMADVQTRCQVFYVCTGDGPAAAMLCPNGTMFNENVRVCDWWYNVDC